MCGLRAGGIADMNSIHRSILARALMTVAALAAVMTASAGGVRSETVIVQGDDGAGGADGVNPGDNGRAATESRWSLTQAA
jgi:hypothetical protein